MADKVSNHLQPWHHLQGKVVMVTGASSGLGRDFCLDLAKAGSNIIAAARRTHRLNSLCHEINHFTCPNSPPSPNTAVRAVAVELDVTADGPAINASVQKAWEAFGRIDVLVNNAGVRGGTMHSLDLPEEEWNDVVKTNLTGSWLVSKYVCRCMRDASVEGSIINISSVAGGVSRVESLGSVAYASSKAGLIAMTKVMAIELGKHNIRVNAIALGLFDSEITRELMKKHWLKGVALRIVPLKDLASSDLALTSLVRYLVHDSSKYVSGNIFIVDSGVSLAGVPIFSSL